MTIKPGADISRLHPDLIRALQLLNHLWAAFFPEDSDGMTVTSGHEGNPGDEVHSQKSKHYIQNNRTGHGEAVDIRLNDVLQWKSTIFASVAWTCLTVNQGDQFRLFAEGILTKNSHFHIQLK